MDEKESLEAIATANADATVAHSKLAAAEAALEHLATQRK